MKVRTLPNSIRGLLLSAGLFLAISLLTSCGMCGEEQIAEAYSPKRSYLARAYVRGCGATTGFMTHANLRPSWSWVSADWKGMITDGEVFRNRCWSKVNFIWADETSLEIQYEKCAPGEDGKDPAGVKENSWDAVKITYLEMPRQIERQ